MCVVSSGYSSWTNSSLKGSGLGDWNPFPWLERNIVDPLTSMATDRIFQPLAIAGYDAAGILVSNVAGYVSREWLAAVQSSWYDPLSTESALLVAHMVIDVSGIILDREAINIPILKTMDTSLIALAQQTHMLAKDSTAILQKAGKFPLERQGEIRRQLLHSLVRQGTRWVIKGVVKGMVYSSLSRKCVLLCSKTYSYIPVTNRSLKQILDLSGSMASKFMGYLPRMFGMYKIHSKLQSLYERSFNPYEASRFENKDLRFIHAQLSARE